MTANPFPVRAWLETSCTLCFAVPAAELRQRLPATLEPDLFEDRLGFVAVAAVDTRGLRPKGLPRFLGNDFILVGYRYFVRRRSPDGRLRRGLMILRSETDRMRMVRLGRLFTPYAYHHADLNWRSGDQAAVVEDRRGGFRMAVRFGAEAALPEGSPFRDWREARRFAGPMPFTFSHDAARRRVIVIEGRRSHWQPRPAAVDEARVPFLDTLGFSELTLANAFVVREVPYEWMRARSEPW